MIIWGTKSKYSHVAICISPEMNLIIEAMSSGVRARDIRKIDEAFDIFRVKGECRYNLNGTISFLVSKLNEQYDYFGFLYLVLLKLLVKLKFPLKDKSNKWQKRRDYFCSELCYEAFFYGGGIDIVPQVAAADITSPADISNSPVLELAVDRMDRKGTPLVTIDK